ncbi:restriction endonuclease subunit S [Streptococcus pseudopneumoniae]|uniref:restriction endonuclease subunit S n=1 Tax=Streptococcus pseudopneumoniae TaxID=257758 RepID=UPI00110C3E3C|nr:restriction endonuclease subunit S [Streptococcus pseudopneumoniae]MBF9637304.1 restriction endonuclease subunit S [Streptococcus pseudopneumoniae]MBF9641326.1 restriction endonuclease subunit S [Streptococcus pseudopneumoniae]MCE2618103.1 restriction endonuclease subunit S [Streptococcus pseudopneumoniae]TMR73320.1 restriction endonuclease subunit S [Streptococcus pseudopneumoniae]
MKKVKLGELVSIQTGKLDANAAVVGGKYPFFTTAKEILWINDYVYDDEVVLVAGNGDLNVKYYKGKFNAYQRTYILSNNSNVKMKYLYYFLDKYIEILRYQSIGGVIKYIKFNNLSNALVPMMSVSEQENIIQNFEKIDYLISKRSQQYTELSNLVKSRFNEMFGDFYTTLFPKYKIGEKFEVSSGSTPSRDNKLYWDSGTINWVKTTEVINREITETEEKITKFALENTSLKLFPVDTILIAMYGQGQTRGRSAILKVESTSNQACGAIFPNKIDNPVFIWHQLMLRYSELRELGRGGNQPNLNGQLIKNFELIFPPLALQNEFADFVAQVDKSQFACEIAIKVWRNSLKFSII